MATLTDIYNRACWDWAEDGGLVLGIVSVQSWLDFANLVLLDLLKQTGCIKRVWTMSVFAGTPTYTVPDDIMNVEQVFLAGRWLPKYTVAELNNVRRNWRRDLDIPIGYYTDNLPPKTIGLAPAPNYNSIYIPGPNEPDPPHGQYDSFSISINNGISWPILTAAQWAALTSATWETINDAQFTGTYTPDQHRGLTIVGTRKADTQLATVGDAIPLLPDDIALSALLWGIHERVFAGDNELKNAQAAAFSHAQYQESVSVLQAITGEIPIPEDKG